MLETEALSRVITTRASPAVSDKAAHESAAFSLPEISAPRPGFLFHKIGYCFRNSSATFATVGRDPPASSRVSSGRQSCAVVKMQGRKRRRPTPRATIFVRGRRKVRT
jgi:hypothetical protein